VTWNWMTDAVCADEDPELFFPTAAPGTDAYAEQVAEAKRACEVCPVVAECLAFALEQLPAGIAGGLTEDERRALGDRERRPAIVASLEVGGSGAADRRRRAEDVAFLSGAGWDVENIARTLKIKPETVKQYLGVLAHQSTEPGSAA
jgi:WhiB family transcriptional regulator, redox-sensing transcriptional regulator